MRGMPVNPWRSDGLRAFCDPTGADGDLPWFLVRLTHGSGGAARI